MSLPTQPERRWRADQEGTAMASDEDDLPVRKGSRPPDLGHWSIDELNEYIRRLEAEILRARAQITAKQSFKGAADELFKKR